MRLFGIIELETQFHGCRFALGLRNSHDRSMRLALVVGYRVAVCENMMFSGEFQRVLAKHSKNFSLVNALSIGIDQMQRNFEPMQIETWGRFFGVRPHKSKIDIHYGQKNRLRRLFEPGISEFRISVTTAKK